MCRSRGRTWRSWPKTAMVALALSAVSTTAQPAWDGNRLLEVCARPTARQRTSDCDVFIRGAIDRYHEFLATRCAPRQVRFGEIVEIIVQYLQEHPADRQRPANDLILASLTEAYSCKS